MKYLECLKRISIKTTTYRCRSTKALTGKKLNSLETYLIQIGHFRVPKTLTFKMRLGAQPFLGNEFYLHENEK